MAKNVAYSKTPLIKKIGFKEGYKIRVINEPANYLELLGTLPDNMIFCKENKSKKDLIHFFATSMFQLESEMLLLKSEIVENGIIWISWNKKSSGIPTDITENKIRDLSLSIGLVDVKVCSIDEKWSGLKLVIPLNKRRR